MSRSEAYIHVRVDPSEKIAAEQVLEDLGLNMATAVRLFMKQIAREKRVPLSLSLEPPANTYADILAAREARAKGFVGRDADAVIADMECVIREAES